MLSVGIIYHYFDNKDELIADLYRELKLDFANKMMKGFSSSSEVKENLYKFWMNTINYYHQHPDETNFLEQYDHSPILKQPIIEEFMTILGLFFQTVEKGTKEGIIKELPIELLISLIIDVAISLAKKQVQGRIELNDDTLELAFHSCWESIVKK